MSVRVNLLRDSEYRHQGVVSRKFALQGSIVVVTVVVVLVALLMLLRRTNTVRNLAWAETQWESLEPIYDRVRAMQAGLNHNNQLAAELNGWKSSRVEWHRELAELQRLVPPSIQLTRLNLRSAFAMVDDPAGAPADAEEGSEPVKVPARQFHLRVDGKAGGARADELVNLFVTALGRSSQIQDLLESLKLQGLQRSPTDQAEAQRVFGVEGSTYLRIMQ